MAAEAVAPVAFGIVADLLAADGKGSTFGMEYALLIMLLPVLAIAAIPFRALPTYPRDVATAADPDVRPRRPRRRGDRPFAQVGASWAPWPFDSTPGRAGNSPLCVESAAPPIGDRPSFGLNYLANVPEVIDLAKRIKQVTPRCFVFAGGHSVSFIADHVIEQADGALDAVLRGEGEVATPLLLAAARDGGLIDVPGVVTTVGSCHQPPLLLDGLDEPRPARDLTRRRRKYFIGVLDPATSIEFTRGCPWDCSFCSAWTFYGRSYRKMSPEAAADEVASIQQPGLFIVDDVAFIRPEHGDAIAAGLEKRKVKKEYYLETRADVLLRHPEVFRRWRRLGLNSMFLGVEALDEEGLDRYRKAHEPG
jgi:radical SAM superfamily enzyme YgiQ (UPF0313 family)